MKDFIFAILGASAITLMPFWRYQNVEQIILIYFVSFYVMCLFILWLNRIEENKERRRRKRARLKRERNKLRILSEE